MKNKSSRLAGHGQTGRTADETRKYIMRRTRQFIVLALVICTSMATVQAQSPREQLKQMVEQLQKTPADDALREKILKLAPTIKPAPAVSPDAEKFEGRAEYAFRNAKTEADFSVAAKEYENAVAAAPWVISNYFNLGVTQERMGRPADAKRSFVWYLKASPNAADAKDVRKRIAGLEFAIEQANSPRGRAEAMLALLRKRYGGPAQRLLICGPKLNAYWVCTDAEAQGHNWVDSVLQDSMPKPGPNPIVFKIVGDGDLIRMQLGSNLFPGQSIGENTEFRGGCAKPNGDDPNAMVWVRCLGWENAGRPMEGVRVLFATDANGAPLIEYRDSCGGSRAADSCRRAQFILQPNS
jgi:hypothetical protein